MLVGGAGGGAPAATADEGAEGRGVCPSPFLTVTWTSSVEPASADWTVYFALVPTVVQWAPPASQRSQRIALRASGADPVQEPWPRRSTCPGCGEAVPSGVEFQSPFVS